MSAISLAATKVLLFMKPRLVDTCDATMHVEARTGTLLRVLSGAMMAHVLPSEDTVIARGVVMRVLKATTLALPLLMRAKSMMAALLSEADIEDAPMSVENTMTASMRGDTVMKGLYCPEAARSFEMILGFMVMSIGVATEVSIVGIATGVLLLMMSLETALNVLHTGDTKRLQLTKEPMTGMILRLAGPVTNHQSLDATMRSRKNPKNPVHAMKSSMRHLLSGETGISAF